MKKILVPLAIYRDNPIIPLHGDRATYFEKIMKYNLFPILLSPSAPQSIIDEAYNMADGVYFTGGEDIDPKFYNAEKHPKTFIGEAERDPLEFEILKKVLIDKKPFLGLCRGYEMLAIVSGGSLIQHLPDTNLPTENHSIKPRFEGDDPYDLLLSEPKHEIIIDKDSRLFKIIGQEKLLVNSLHHQAIEKVGEDFLISAKSPEGVIEAIEHKDPNYFCFGVQSHPEIEKESFFEKLFAEFAKAV